MTFDLDGTLIDTPFNKIVFAWLDKEFARLGVADARSLCRREQLHRFAQGLPVEGYDWDGIVQTVASKRGVRFARSICAEMESGELAASLRRFAPYPDVIPALVRLRAAGYRIVAVSNGFASYQRLTLDLMGVGGYFDAVLGPDGTGFVKPDPRVFAADGIEPPVVAHLGDLLTQDVACARLAGVPAVLVLRSDTQVPGLDRYKVFPPQARPGEMLADGWLARQYAKELRYAQGEGVTADIDALSPAHPAVPDAAIFTLAELADIFQTM